MARDQEKSIDQLPIGEAIKQLIDDAEGFTYDNVSRRSGGTITGGVLRAIADGRRPQPKVETMENVAALFGVPPDTFAAYRLAKARRLLNEKEVGLEAALSRLSLLDAALEVAADVAVEPAPLPGSGRARQTARESGGARRRSQDGS